MKQVDPIKPASPWRRVRRVSVIVMWVVWAGILFVQVFVARGGKGEEHRDLVIPITFGLFALFVTSGLVMFASTVMLIRRARSEFARALEAVPSKQKASSGQAREFKGAARLSTLFQVSRPMARMRIDPERLTIDMPFVGSIVIPSARVVSVKPKRGFLSRGGMRIDTDIGAEYVTFFPMDDPDSVMRALQSAGYPCPASEAASG